MKASHEEHWVTVTTGRGQTEVKLQPGQFIFGRNQAAAELGDKPISTYKRMLKLKKLGNLNIQSNTHYSIVTICNWDKYQSELTKEEQPKEQASINQVSTKYQPSNTYKNVKNDKNVKNNKYINNTHPSSNDEGRFYLTKKKKKLKGKKLEMFEEFWETFGWKQGKAAAADAWLEIEDLQTQYEKILEGAKRYAKTRKKLLEKGLTPKWAEGWLRARRWEDEEITMEEDDDPFQLIREKYGQTE